MAHEASEPQPTSGAASAERLDSPDHGPAPPEQKPTYFPSWPFNPMVIFIRRLAHLVVFFPILRWLNPLYVHGRENIDGLEGPFIFVANHSSHLDTPALMRAMPAVIRRRMTAAAAQDYFFTSWIRGFFAFLVCNAFPFPRKGREGIERAKWLLANGWHIMLYPEGTRSKDGSISKFRPGVGLIACESQAYVIPVALLGMGRVLPKGNPLPKRASVELRIGQAMRFSPDQDPVEATAAIEESVRQLTSPEGIELARGRVRKR
ncbi:MAG: 1-acyl-sn-glycerol-3-phosphate acyltransferase [Armatimonadetes bacterium]|nr:1-acyl-sn-glycerol-3-phosphate acyltransferase [Armatimonadota bacterium]